ncbi:MAG: DNA polymerase III subunit gamma/tau [Syntrophaceae bacterium]|nr:DNA polymerase III subunit gamma/tau [Syntrophaceae bacterium]
MSYLVLARKWRPQVFEDVIGQRHITQTLQNAISQKRVAHAFLFTGARGVGKTSTARILAKALNCETGPGINPCNRCTACHEISSGTSVDVVEIDGASNRGIDEIRELREHVRYTPAKSRYKIYIIDEVHMLTREAFNALLKTLEEPPPHILFIFATTEPHKIPATILSRCQRYDFKRIPLREIVDNLKRIAGEEQVQISERGIFSIAQEAEGSLRDAQSLLDQVISYGGRMIRDEDIAEVLGVIDRKILHDTIEAIANKDAQRCMEIVGHIYHYGYDLQHFCQELLQWFRNLILIKVSQEPEGLMELPKEEFETLRRQAGRFQFDHLNHLFSLLLKGEEEIAQSAFPRIMLEMTLIRMSTLRPLLPIDEILKKLEGLEKKGGPTVAIENDRERLSSSEPEGSEEEESTELIEEMEPLDEGASRGSDSENFEKERKGHERSEKAGEEVWKGLVDFTRARSPVLGSFLALGSLVHMDGDRIEIGFEKDSFHYERMIEKDNRNQLELICQEYFKGKPKVVISPLEQGIRLKTREVSRVEETVKDPLVQEALRLFNGKIVDG